MAADEQHRFYDQDGLGTQIYDAWGEILHAASAAGDDVPFYVEQARRWGSPVLDLGCGTGRIGIALAREGFDVLGLDLSAPMLRIAERKRAQLPREVGRHLTFVEGDLTDFDMGRTFPLVITPSRSFQFMLTPQAQRSALAAMRRHLRPDGALVLQLFDPRLEWVVPEPHADLSGRQTTVRNPMTGRDVRIEVIERAPDPGRQLIDELYRFTEVDEAGQAVRSMTERLVLRWSLRSEIRHLAELEGFVVEGEYGDFRGGAPAYGGEQVWILRPA